MTRPEALDALRLLAAGVHEETEDLAVARLLERVASAEPELHAVLLEAGARALLHDVGV